jgi:hypothetical protein
MRVPTQQERLVHEVVKHILDQVPDDRMREFAEAVLIELYSKMSVEDLQEELQTRLKE